MIKEVMENKINKNFDLIVNEIVNYFGNEYRKEIVERFKNVRISLVEDGVSYSVGKEEFYIGKEPICVKEEEGSHVIVPFSLFCDDRGNVIFVHGLLHAIGEECLVEDNKYTFNEVIVDYMANEISKRLEKQKINITMVNNPVYESKSFYSTMFDKVEDFYENYRKEIIDGRMGKKVTFEGVQQYIYKAEEIIDNVFLQSESEEKVITKRR